MYIYIYIYIYIYTGVSTYLDQSDQQSRIRGMKIAKEFSMLLNHKISFDELDKHENKTQHQEEYQKQNSAEYYSNTKSKENILYSSAKQTNEKHSDYDSSDSEIEGYVIPIENSDETINITHYLRNCLEFFLVSDTDEKVFFLVSSH
jgi:hypothetical protein